jgi:ribosome recycling factor
MSVDEIILNTEDRMQKSVEAASAEMSKIRTGRASANMLEGISVDYYGTATPINQMANISVPEPRLVTITPWDRSQIGLIEKAILASDLGITPSSDGSLIRLKVPELTEERRNDLAKVVRKYGEDGKIAVRNVRRDANEQIKKLQKDSEISEDEEKIYHDEIQQLTDKYTVRVEEIVKAKEKDLLEI